MTWVVGSGVIFGYGALIADTRITWPDGSHDDVLQKIHMVGSQLMVGFSGSVDLGFEMVDDLRRSLRVPVGHIWWPRIAAWRWWRRGRRLFRSAPAQLQALGSSLLLVGVSGYPNAFGGGISFAILMESPDFRPRFVRGGEWISIGSGSEHRVAQTIAQDQAASITRFYGALGQGEVGTPGGMATIVASMIAVGLAREPHPSVSESIQVGLVFLDSDRIQDMATTIDSGHKTERVIRPGRLIKSGGEFLNWQRTVRRGSAHAIA